MNQISIIVPMYNEAQHICRTLAAAQRAAKRAQLDCELIVVDNGSSDNGPSLAAAAGARVLHHPGLTIGALRNRGAAASQADWLAFLDADIEVPDQWLQIWQQVYQTQRADVLALDCDTPPCAPWFARAWQRRKLADSRLRPWLPGANLCLARAWFDRVDGFDEQLRTGEDKDFSLRLRRSHARLLSLSEPRVWHWGFEASWQEWLGKELWRQGSHLHLLKGSRRTQLLSRLRLLRFPLLCLGQCLVTLMLCTCLLLGRWPEAAWLLLLELPAATALALRRGYQIKQAHLLMQLCWLHWLRLHLGGAAFVLSLCRRPLRRPERG